MPQATTDQILFSSNELVILSLHRFDRNNFECSAVGSFYLETVAASCNKLQRTGSVVAWCQILAYLLSTDKLVTLSLHCLDTKQIFAFYCIIGVFSETVAGRCNMRLRRWYNIAWYHVRAYLFSSDEFVPLLSIFKLHL